MKKILVMAIAVVAFAFASCNGGSKKEAAPTNDSTATDSAATAVLSDSVKTTADNLTASLESSLKAKDNTAIISSLANLQTIYKNLVENGKLDEAKAYASAIQKFVNDHAEELKTYTSGNTTIASLVEGIKNLPTSATTTAEQAKAAVTQDVTSLASSAIAKGATTVATAEEAAKLIQNAPSTVKEAANVAANAAVNTAEQKATDAANTAVEGAKKKAQDNVNKATEKANKSVEKAQQKANDAINKGVNKLFGN